MAEAGPPTEGIVVTRFIASDDVERSRHFYTNMLGGTLERSGEPANIAPANSWIIINRGGGATDDKPAVALETPSDSDRVSSFLNIRVEPNKAVLSAPVGAWSRELMRSCCRGGERFARI
jgi:hypothetical protein